MSINITDLQRQIQQNCHISDANFSGAFSLCILLLRLRNLYKWEVNMPPWQEPDRGDLLKWVEGRESLWLGLEGSSPEALVLNGQVLDSLDAPRINQLLKDSGLFYGAGLVTGMKPSYFLARPIEVRVQEGLEVCIVDQELARDIFSAPLMRQGGQIVARRQAMASTLWDEVLELRASSSKALSFAFAQYGLNLHRLRKHPVLESHGFMQVVNAELETWIYHEIGEAMVDTFPGQVWQRMVSEQANTLVEVFARAVRDLLADTHPFGLLGHIISEKKSASLGFYAALMRPLSRNLYPDILPAVQDFMFKNDWDEIERVRRSGYSRGREMALQLVEVYENTDELDPETVRNRVVDRIIRPMGLADSLDGESRE